MAAVGLCTGELRLAGARDPGFILGLRGLRFACAAVAGCGLAVAGVLMQGLFRNPLADPSVTGVTAGACLGGQAALLCQGLAGTALVAAVPAELLIPVGTLAGAGLSLTVLLMIARRRGDLVLVLLVGFILSSLFGSLAAFLVSLAHNYWELGRAMVHFLQGGVEGLGWRHLALAAPLVGGGLVAAFAWARSLDLLLTGEDEARALGLDVAIARRWLLVWTAVLVAGAIALGGLVAFVGLIVPHALRGVIGAPHRKLIPAAALGGALFVAGCDLALRLIPARGAIGLGVVTGLVGAPVFLLLLIRFRRQGML